MTTTMPRSRWRALAAGLVLALGLAACGGDGSGTGDASTSDDGSTPEDGESAEDGAGSDDGSSDDEGADAEPTTVRLLSHDSFYFPEELLAQLEEEQGIVVELLPGGDAGTVVNQAILTAGNPQADVLFGIDSTLLTRGLEAELFEPYEAEALSAIPDDLELDPEHRVTPIDVSDVCVNYDRLFYGEERPPVPASLDDLTDPAYRGQLVVQNPASSSPGLAFLLRTIAEYGEDGWQAYWQALVDNDVQITAGWEDAYYGAFSGGLSSEGDRPLVVSYSTSPPAEVVYGPDPDAEESPTGSIVDTCYRQVEFAGVLSGTEVPEAARAVVEFLASPAFQESVALNMFVEPARDDVELPEVFVRFAERPEEPVELAPEVVTENRDRWIEEWTELVLG
jgi:thiamine transport system substrate-binding protein